MPLLIVTLAGCLSQGCSDQSISSTATPPVQLVVGEGTTTVDGFTISSGNVVLKTGEPGVAFATVTVPQGSKEIAYFLIFSHDFPKADVNSDGGTKGANANTSHTIEAFGNRCKVAYSVRLDDQRKTREEGVTVGGNSMELNDGRVFLIDLNAKPAAVSQLDLDLPKSVPSLDQSEATERFAKTTLDSLRAADATVAEFCQSAHR